MDLQANQVRNAALKNINSGGLKELSNELSKKQNIVKDLIYNSMENISLIRDFTYKSSSNLNKDSIAGLSNDSITSITVNQHEVKDNKELLMNRMIMKELRLKLTQSEEMLKEYKDKYVELLEQQNN